MKHPLTTRLRDRVIAIKLLFLGWLAATVATFFGTIYFLIPADLPSIWFSYQASRALAGVGLENLAIVPPSWSTPWIVLEWATERLPATVLKKWDTDFQILILTPATVAGVFLIVYFVIATSPSKEFKK